jgi:hypothetical protein
MGVVIEIIWNYLPIFFVVLRMYSFYSNFICISSILNMRFETVYAFLIILFGYLTSSLVTTSALGGRSPDFAHFVLGSFSEAKVRLMNN